MNTELQTRQVLIVEDKESAASETIASAIDRLIQALEDKDISVQIAESYCEAFPVVETNMDIDCFLVASDMDYDKASESRAAKLLKQIKERQVKPRFFCLRTALKHRRRCPPNSWSRQRNSPGFSRTARSLSRDGSKAQSAVTATISCRLS